VKYLKLRRVDVSAAEKIWRMQVESFQAMLDKYKDYGTSPANEDTKIMRQRFNQNFTYYYIIISDNEEVGAIRVVDKKDGSRKRISPIFILSQ